MSSGWRTPTLENPNPNSGSDNGKANDASVVFKPQDKGLDLADQALARYLDGLHCLDEICEEVGLSEREAVKKLKGFGDVVFVHR